MNGSGNNLEFLDILNRRYLDKIIENQNQILSILSELTDMSATD